MKKILVPILLPLLCGLAFAEAVTSADNPGQAPADSFKKRFAAGLRHPPESEARLNRWFRDAKFGVFIHFGAYSHLAGQYKGNSDGPPYAEWAMMTHRIPLEEYRGEVVSQFNPQGFDADQWARIFKESGMRYVVITSKHHDGFALFKSRATDYNAVDGSPFRRDIIKELGEACHRHGLKFGVYYSQAFDWSEPGAPFPSPEAIRQIHPGLPAGYEANEKTMDEYLARKAYPQVQELMENYKIDLVWFDTPAWMKPGQGRRFLEIVRKNNPDCLVNSRLLYWPKEEWKPEQLEFFDYVSLEDKEVPPHKLPLTTESPDSVSTSYGYKAHGAVRYHTLREIIHRFVHTVCGGGNYLLNFGPMGNGKVDPKALGLFQGVGAWLKDNGESIYGTQANPLPARPAWGDANLSKDGKTLYLHVMKWPDGGKLAIEGVAAKVESVAFLAPKAAEAKVVFAQEGKKLSLKLPGHPPDANDSVLKVSLAHPFEAAAEK
jgi:alpha-L-fucosidase